MGLPKLKMKLSAEEYLAWEAEQDTRNEYFDGEVFAMVGARLVHNIAIQNLVMVLRTHLKGKTCRIFMQEVKARVESANCFFYPDIVVTCDPRDRTQKQYIDHPALVLEVLSDSTAAYDRGLKFAAYRKLESLLEYGLVDLASQRIEIFRRDATNHWVLHEFGIDDTVEFASVNANIPAADIFEDTAEPPDSDNTDSTHPAT